MDRRIVGTLLGLLFAVPAMGQLITNLPAVSTPDGTELVAIYRADCDESASSPDVTTCKMTLTQVQSTILSTGDVTTTIILDDTILEVDLDAIDSPSDGECLAYDLGTLGFEWVSCGSGAGDSITVNSSAATDPDFADGDVDWTLAGGNSITATVACTGCIDATDMGADSVAASEITTGGVATAEILDGTILEGDLSEDSGAPTDGDILTYDSTGTNFVWITQNAGTDVTADLEEDAHCSEHDSTDINCTGETIVVVDDQHNHTGTSLSGVDISDDTNLAGGTGITLTGDTLAADLGSAITTGEITNNEILEADLNEDSGTPTDEDVLTYDSTGANFVWVTQASLNTNAATITDDAIVEADLKAVDAAADEECLTYETTTGDFEWQACGAGSGDITDVFSCATGDCASITMAATDLLDMSGTDASTATEGLILPQHATACAGGTAEGQPCWEADANILHVGDGATIQDFPPASAISGDATMSGTGALTLGTDVITPTELDDDANSPTAGFAVIVEAGAASFDYIALAAAAFVDVGDDGGVDNDLVEVACDASTGICTEPTAGKFLLTFTDNILEAHLKAVDAAADEECLTYESTTGDFEWQACGAGGSEWTDTGTVLHPTETGDDVALGNTTLVNAAKLSIDGDADQVQLTVQENATQTDASVIVETSAGTEVATVEPGGLVTTAVGLDAIGAVDMDYGSADVTDHTFTTDGTGDAEVVLPNDSIGLAEMAGGTDGNLITYDASGDPAAVATGTSGQVLTSNGAGAAPTFQAAAGGSQTSVMIYTGPRAGTVVTSGAVGNELMDCWLIPTYAEVSDPDRVGYSVEVVDADDVVNFCMYSKDGATRYVNATLGVTATGLFDVTNSDTGAIPAADLWWCIANDQVNAGSWQISASQASGSQASPVIFYHGQSATSGACPSTLTSPGVAAADINNTNADRIPTISVIDTSDE